MIDYSKLEKHFWKRAIITSVVSLIGISAAIGDAYSAGNVAKCKQLVEKGYDPEEIFLSEDAENDEET